MVLNPRSEIWKYFDNIVAEGVAVCKLCKQRLKNERSCSLRKHINSLHKPNTDLWKYFLNIVEEGIAECKICKKGIRNNRNFNLSLHLKQHNITIVDESAASSAAAVPASDGDGDGQTPSKESLYIVMEEKLLVNAVLGLMIDEGVDPLIFSSKNMQALLHPVCDAISRQRDKNFTINERQSERVIQSVANFIRDEFVNEFHGRLLSLTIDSDASNSSNTVCVSVQFVRDAQLETRVLGEIHVAQEQPLSGKCITNKLREFNIDAEQIVSAYWDNFKARFSVSNCEYLEQIKEFERNPQILIGDVKLERYVGVVAQLCVLDILKNPIIWKLFVECRNLIGFINATPQVFSEAFKQNSLNMPHLDSPWEWGSTYSMMNDLKNACGIVGSLKYEPPETVEDGFIFNETLKNFIEAFCKTLRFCQNCLQKFCNSEMIYGDFYGQWLKCKLLTERLYDASSEEDTILALISSQLLKSFESRSHELLDRDHFKACLYLDPRFQRTLKISEKMVALDYLQELWQRAKRYNKELVKPLPEPLPAKHVLQPKGLDDDDDNNDILNEFLSNSFPETGSTGEIFRKLQELRLPFQTAETNVMMYWQEQNVCEPEIHTLATILFSMPATHNYNKITIVDQQSFVYTNSVSPIFQENVTFIRLNQRFVERALTKLDLFTEDDSLQMEISETQGTPQDAANGSKATDLRTVTCPAP